MAHLQLDYALNKEEYSLKNALCYGIFKGHIQKAFYEKNSSFGRRFVHFLIVVAELVPIAAVFELVIVKGVNYFNEKNNIAPKKISNSTSVISKDPLKNIPRTPYNRLPNESEKANINYIINMLATSYTATILWNKTALAKASIELLNLHPLRILTYIHDDKDLNAKMTLIKNRPSISLFGGTISIWAASTLGMAYRLTYYLTDREIFDKEYAEFAKHLKLLPPKPILKPIPNDIPQEEKELMEKIALAFSFIQPIENKF